MGIKEQVDKLMKMTEEERKIYFYRINNQTGKTAFATKIKLEYMKRLVKNLESNSPKS